MCKKRTIYLLAICYLRYVPRQLKGGMNGGLKFAPFCEICTLVYNVEVGNTPAEERVSKAKGGHTHCLKHGNTHKDAHTYVPHHGNQPTHTSKARNLMNCITDILEQQLSGPAAHSVRERAAHTLPQINVHTAYVVE